MVIVHLTAHHGANCPGDTCGLEPEVAARLISIGAARLVSGDLPPDPVQAADVPEPVRGAWREEDPEGNLAPAAPVPASSPLPEAWTKNAPRKR